MRRSIPLVMIVFWLAGCGSGPNWYHPVGPGSPTGDLGLELDLSNPQEQQYARYRVKPDGTVVFWGGRDVVFDEVTWTGPLPHDSAVALEQLVRSGSWFASPPRGDGEGDDVWTISVLEPGRRRDFTIHGHVKSVDDAWKILQSTSSQRFRATLDSLPRPSIESLPLATPGTTGSEPAQDEQQP